MTRPIFASRFEEPEDDIKTRLKAAINEEWRAEEGDFMYDAAIACSAEIKQLEIKQDESLKAAFAQYAEGGDLDAKVAEQGLTRKAATPNKRGVFIEAQAGVTVPAGTVVSQIILDNNGTPLEYATDADVIFTDVTPVAVALTCRTAGTVGNVPNGTEFILSDIPGITAITDGGTTTPGTDIETDESLYQRYWFKVTHPDTGGNKYDFERWTMEIPEVGKVKVFPRMYGEGTVGVVLVGTDYAPASQYVIDTVQEYLDPDGQGLGEGKAPANAKTTVTAAVPLNLNITANVIYDNISAKEVVDAAFLDALNAYLHGILFTNHPNVLLNRVSSLLISTSGVIDHHNLLINGAAADVTVNEVSAPVIKSIMLTSV
jgi:uncharacterized phage protein gp47/JayE